MRYRYDELKETQKIWWDTLPEDMKYQMTIQNDVTFGDYILASTKEGDIIEIDYESYRYEVVGKY